MLAAGGIALIDASALDVLTQLSSMVSRVGLAAAGLLLVVLSRLRPGGPHAWFGLALVVLSGFGGIFQAVWALALDPVVAYTVLVPVAAVALFLGARAHDEAGALTVTIVGGLLVALLLVLHLGTDVRGVQALFGAGALAAVAVRFAHPNRLATAHSENMVLALSALAASSALTPLLGEVPVAGMRSALMVGAAVGLVVMAAHCTHEAVVTTHRTVDSLVIDLATHEQTTNRLQEHLHDARSTLAGIRASNDNLSRASTAPMDSFSRSSLESAIESEVGRLERLLCAESAQSAELMDLADLVEPVLITMRERGLRVICQPVDVSVVACRDAVAEILTNLLDNCLHHAPGATARITVDTTGAVVLLSVMDNGPGIDADLRGAVFDSGVRARADGPGQGIGLAASRRLAREQGGDLRLVDANGGCWFVLRLPVGGSAC